MEEAFVLNKAVKLLQPDKGFRTSLDSVFLASACRARQGERILDLGCGVGSVGLCILHRIGNCHLTGIDINSQCIEIAKLNASKNNVEGFADFTCSDIAGYCAEDTFDHVVCNPPYLDAGNHTPSPDKSLALANGFIDNDRNIKEWIDCGFRCLKSGGTFTIINRADALDKIIMAFGKKFGGVEIFPLLSFGKEPAKRVIIRAIKDRKTPLILHAGIVIHNADGTYTLQTEDILRHGKSIEQATEQQ